MNARDALFRLSRPPRHGMVPDREAVAALELALTELDALRRGVTLGELAGLVERVANLEKEVSQLSDIVNEVEP